MGGRPPVLVLGGFITALGTIRSLAASGIEAWVHPGREPYLRWSRFYRAYPAAFAARPTAADLSRLLEGHAGERPVLMPVSDAWVRALAELRGAGWPSSTPPPEAVATLLDKGRLSRALLELGIPHPRTFFVSSLEQARAALESGIEDAFLKPCDSYACQAAFGRKAWRVSGIEQAAERLEAAAASGLELLVQEYVPGPATRHFFVDGFVDREGVVRATFARQRLRMNPPDFGDSSALVSIAPQRVEPAIEALRTLLRGLRYRGIFSAEFKQDPRDGCFKLIEVNARPWMYVEFATRAGVNVCEMAWRDALGLPVATVTSYRVGLHCVYPRRDRQAGLAQLRRGQLGAAEWLRSWVGAHMVIPSLADPLPGVAEVAAAAQDWLRRRVPAGGRRG